MEVRLTAKARDVVGGSRYAASPSVEPQVQECTSFALHGACSIGNLKKVRELGLIVKHPI